MECESSARTHAKVCPAIHFQASARCCTLLGCRKPQCHSNRKRETQAGPLSSLPSLSLRSHRKLWRWVKKQREQMKADKLKPDRQRLLAKIPSWNF